MKKIENRAFVCLLLALALGAGMILFLFRYLTQGGSWASSAFNRHLYNTQGQLTAGTVLDRDGDVLSSAENGERTYYDSETVRKATLHAVGDLQGNIGTGALNAFAGKLTGWNLVNGAFGAGRGGELTLTIDARYNYEAYQALNGHAGTVAVYNYKTGEILCMVSAPSYDPLNVPEDIETNDRWKGAYVSSPPPSPPVPSTKPSRWPRRWNFCRTWKTGPGTAPASSRSETKPSSAPASMGSRISPPPSPTAATPLSLKLPWSWGRTPFKSTRRKRALPQAAVWTACPPPGALLTGTSRRAAWAGPEGDRTRTW